VPAEHAADDFSRLDNDDVVAQAGQPGRDGKATQTPTDDDDAGQVRGPFP